MVATPVTHTTSMLPPLRYALPGWAAIALLCALLPASIQQQWGLLASSWFWALLALLAWRGQQLVRTTPRRWRPRRHRGATPLRSARIAPADRCPGTLTTMGNGPSLRLRRANSRSSKVAISAQAAWLSGAGCK